MNTKEIRALFPITKETVYLNSASQAPLNLLVFNKLQNCLNTELSLLDKKGFNRDKIRVPLSKLLGGSPEEYALTSSTGVGIGMIAQGLKFKKGDNIIIPENEHWNTTYPWLHLQKKGVEIRFAKMNNNVSFEPAVIKKLIDKNTRVIAMAAVRFNSGFRPNLSAIAKIAHENNALFVVDAAQAAGMIPIDVQKDQIDVLAGCGFKWLLGMHGTGFLYVSNKVVKMINPVLPGMFAAERTYDQLSFYEDSRKFETGTIAYTLFDAWSAGLELLLKIGIENIYKKALENTDIIIDGLLKKKYQIISPIKKIEDRSAIIHFNSGALETTKMLYQKLLSNNILVTLQEGNIRVSPNFFTTKKEIKLFLELI
jgi:selenocysteine lyase/cysteine desulfurase